MKWIAISMIIIAVLLVLTGLWVRQRNSEDSGIVALGSAGNGVLIKGEAIVLNDKPDVSDAELLVMFKEAVAARDHQENPRLTTSRATKYALRFSTAQ